MPRSRINGAVPLFPPYTVMVWTGESSAFTQIKLKSTSNGVHNNVIFVTEYSFDALHGRTRLRGPPFRKRRSIRHKRDVIPRFFQMLQKFNAAADVISKDTPTDWVQFALNSPRNTPRIRRSQTRGQLSFTMLQVPGSNDGQRLSSGISSFRSMRPANPH